MVVKRPPGIDNKIKRYAMSGRLIGIDLPERFKEYKRFYRYMKRCKSFREALMHGGAVVYNEDSHSILHLRLRKDGKTIFDDAAWYFAPKYGITGYLG